MIIEYETEKELEDLVRENEQNIVDAFFKGIDVAQTEDVLVVLVRDGDSVDIGMGLRLDFLKEIKDIHPEFIDKIKEPAPKSEIPNIKNFWTVAVDTESGDDCLWLMSTCLINSFGGIS